MKKTAILSVVLLLLLALSLTVLSACTFTVEFEVNFIVDGHTYYIATANGNGSIKMPENPTKDDYTFDGWYWDEGVWEKPFTPSSLNDTPISGDMNVYAKWKCDHKQNYFVVDIAPTCTEAGIRVEKCSNCDKTITDTVENALGHTEVIDEAIAPTCTNTGLTEGKHCSVCKEMLVKQNVLPTIPHSYEATSTTPPCTEVGYTTYTCSECGDSYLSDKVEILGHVIVNNACVNCGSGAYTDLEYELNPDGSSYVIVGCGSFEGSELLLPDTYLGLPVTSIDDEAFSFCDNLTSVTIPNSITSIGDLAFFCCRSLINIIVDKDNEQYKVIDGNLYTKDGTTIIQYAIGKSDTEFIIPDSVTDIGMGAFAGSAILTSVTIGNGVTSIGDYAFSDSKYLVSMEIPDSVITIGEEAFSGCIGLESVTIGNGVVSIDYWAFYHCTGLTSVTIPNSVTSIGDEAFYDCGSLMSVTIGNGINYIGDRAFHNCFDLTSVYYLGAEAEWYEITISSNNEEFNYAIRYYYSESEPEVEGYFWHCVDGKIEVWTEYIPYYSEGLEYTLNEDGESYTVSGIDTCEYRNIVIPDTYLGLPVTSIGERAFEDCDSLTSVTIPDSVTSIGDWAFYDCDSLKSVYYLGTEAEWNEITIGSNNEELNNATRYYSAN